MDAKDLLTSFDGNGVLGELTGADEAALARLFADALKQAEADLDEARLKARASSEPIRVDASRLSGVNGGDAWRVEPDGAVHRELDRFERVEQMLSLIPAAHGVQAPAHQAVDLDSMRPLLARMAYNGLWSPSGTNWQPIRTLELTAEDVAFLTADRHRLPGLAVLARAEYTSILGDVACLCGLCQASHAEDIDLGIWLEVAHRTAQAHGWAFTELDLDPVDSRALLLKRLAERSADDIRASLERRQHHPARLLLPAKTADLKGDLGAPASLARSDLDRLVEARSTQRVASPQGDLPPVALEHLWAVAQAAVSHNPSAEPGDPLLVRFNRDDEVPAHIGRCMHAGIEGPEGLAKRIELDKLCACLELPAEPDAPLPASAVPEHLRAKLVSGGGYAHIDDHLVDRRDRPLTAGRLVKLIRLLTRSFGKYFLSFHNTHPSVGVLLTRPYPAAYEHAGRLVAHMGLLARARGLVSIIKSGPVEIARDAISDLISPQLPDPAFEPLLTFQLGLPLGPAELVSEGASDEHDGLMERKLDRRAPRARLAEHYVPADE